MAADGPGTTSTTWPAAAAAAHEPLPGIGDARACRRRSPPPPARPGRAGPARRRPRPTSVWSLTVSSFGARDAGVGQQPPGAAGVLAGDHVGPASSSTARGERSPRLPIGVATSTRAPRAHGAAADLEPVAGPEVPPLERAGLGLDHRAGPPHRPADPVRAHGHDPQHHQVGVAEGDVDGEAHAHGVHRAGRRRAAGPRRCRRGRAGPCCVPRASRPPRGWPAPCRRAPARAQCLHNTIAGRDP